MTSKRTKPSFMKRTLKNSRVVLAIFFFISVSLIFLDIHGYVPKLLFNSSLYFQLIPSILLGIRVFSFAATGFIAVLLLTILFGRIYCSSICPLGILMDIITFLRNKFGGKIIRRKYSPPHSIVRYSILIATVLMFVSGSVFLVNLLDPFSNFGRIAVSLVKPLVVQGNNAAGLALESTGNYSLSTYSLKTYQIGVIVYTLVFASIIGWLAFTRGRLYCNMICPVGTLLGLVSKNSVFKIRIDKELCTECGKCERQCKSGCIDIENMRIDHSRCVACFNCLTLCSFGATDFGFPIKSTTKTEDKVESKNRRRVLASIGLSIALLPDSLNANTPIKVTVPNKISLPELPHPLLPPGSLGLGHFTSTCTACHACVAVCPPQVLQPSLAGYGLSGLFMPHLDPDSGFCNLNCNECGDICPSGAITDFTLEEKKQIQVGVVEFIRDNCIVVLQDTACGACSEHCPTKAVYMVSESKQFVPKVNQDICLG